MNDVFEISSDSSDTIIFSSETDFHQEHQFDNELDVQSLVTKYISENCQQSDAEIVHSERNYTDEDTGVSSSKKQKRCSNSDVFLNEPASSSRDESTSETDLLYMLSEKYKQVLEDTSTDLNGGCNSNSKKRGELKQQEKELQKKQKVVEREKKKQDLEREKSLKKALAEANKNSKPAECMKFITVHIDSEIINEEYGNDVIKALQESDVKYEVQSQIFPCTISWTRKVQSHLINDNGKLVLSTDRQDTDEILLVLSCKELLEHVSNNTLITHIQSLKSVLVNKKITLAVSNLQSYVRYQKNQKHRDWRSQITNEERKATRKEKDFKDIPKTTKRDVEIALTELQLLCCCSHRLIETSAELGLMVLQFTKAVAELPYKLEKQEKYQRTDWFAAGDNRDCVQVDRSGNGLNRLWNQMLTSFPLARLETAEAITSKYPTVTSLMAAYDNCATTKAAELLLQDIPIRRAAGPLSTSRKIGPELSKKIYNFFTSTDGDSPL